ncbi:MAG: hypothetical protein JKY13_00065 [Gammaproteobacteria bacterium]|nr:hypothetical protein [Gammaproteobacteria bacterium]
MSKTILKTCGIFLSSIILWGCHYTPGNPQEAHEKNRPGILSGSEGEFVLYESEDIKNKRLAHKETLFLDD